MQECRPIYRILRRDLPEEYRDFLIKSQCGRDGNKVIVCCPNTFTIDDLPEECGVEAGDRIVGGEETSVGTAGHGGLLKRAVYVTFIVTIIKIYLYNFVLQFS